VLMDPEVCQKDEGEVGLFPENDKKFKPQIYTKEEIALLNHVYIPQHVAIIMDGNRRWEKEHHMPSLSGHWKGAEVLTRIVRAASELGVRTLTAFAFSTENWMRSEEEIESLMHLFELYLVQQGPSMKEEGVRLRTIGDLSKLPQQVQKAIQKTQEDTFFGDKIDLILAINYGGRDEIMRAIHKMIVALEEKKIERKNINEDLLSNYLDTAGYLDPELLIRTSGEQRLSNFLLWQTTYTEIFIEDVFWPDFSERHLYKAILNYQNRKRRFGGA
jgi:undecaprenyl diphosphate synthase